MLQCPEFVGPAMGSEHSCNKYLLLHCFRYIYSIVLYSQTKGVKQKYILCISGLVAYRQYIHNCSSLVDPRLAHGSESTICASALLGLSLLSRACLSLRLSAAEPSLRNDSQTPELAPLSSAGLRLSLSLSSREGDEFPPSVSTELSLPRTTHPIRV